MFYLFAKLIEKACWYMTHHFYLYVSLFLVLRLCYVLFCVLVNIMNVIMGIFII